MTAKPKARNKCKHPNLDKKLRCKTCHVLVDIREKKNKYGARRTDGFDSAKEARRDKVLASDPRVFGLQRQKNYPLVVNGILICTYRADFVYVLIERPTDPCREVVEDAKPKGKAFKKTEAYRLFQVKKKLMLACHGIEVIEV